MLLLLDEFEEEAVAEVVFVANGELAGDARCIRVVECKWVCAKWW